MAEPHRPRYRRFVIARACVEGLAFVLVAGLVAQTAVMAKQSKVGPALVAIDDSGAVDVVLGSNRPAVEAARPARDAEPARVVASDISAVAVEVTEEPVDPRSYTPPEGFLRYFDGRPIRPVKTIVMTVTAYSPDHRSCPGTDDGYTATNHSVWTNAMRMVAADTDLLPFGSLVSVPGYAEGEVVPVLDRGGAIKGRRLDVLYPTHEIARQWGRKRLTVTVWEYADGKPSTLGTRKRG